MNTFIEIYIAFHRLGQAKFAYGGSVLVLRQWGANAFSSSFILDVTT